MVCEIRRGRWYAASDTYGINLPASVRERIIQRVGWPVPYYLQLIFNGLRDRIESGEAATEALSQVLSRSIADPDGREDKLRYLLDVLENDGYLVEHAGRWRFRFPLLREYWLKRVAS